MSLGSSSGKSMVDPNHFQHQPVLIAVVRPSSRRLAPDYESFPGSSSRSEKSVDPRSPVSSISGRGDAG
jgi:hypothetical protein